MKPHSEGRALAVHGAAASVSFGISTQDAAHIMGILRSGLYSDRILAVLREYGANAWDAHRSVGKADVPIQIVLPTYDSELLTIRDYGPGLSHEDMFRVFTQYGRSTKRDSDDVVGQLGIGSKSGFAYADTFTVISRHAGAQRTYVAALDATETGTLSLLHEQECPLDDTGLEIQIATLPRDRAAFHNTARELFRYFTPRPNINTTLPPAPSEQTVLTHGAIYESSHQPGAWVALMGCVPYKVDLDQLDLKLLPKCIPNLGGMLNLDIGSVAMAASREGLRYTQATKAALVDKFTALVDEYVAHAFATLEAAALTAWERRLRMRVLHQMELPLPEAYKALAIESVALHCAPGAFTVLRNGNAVTYIDVEERTRFLIDDTGCALAGYSLRYSDYVVRSAHPNVEQLLTAALNAASLTGVAIERLSALPWTAPYVKPKRTSNPKHRARMFAFAPSHRYKAPWSNYWAPIVRTPTPEDVFVIIEGFKPTCAMLAQYRTDKDLADAFGQSMPTIYGYKSTEAKPVVSTTCVGVPYATWRKTFIASLMTPERLALIAEAAWLDPGDLNISWPGSEDRAWLTTTLGAQHPIVDVVQRQHMSKALDQKLVLLAEAGNISLGSENSAATAAIEALRQRYPLLMRLGLRAVWYRSWPDYSDQHRLEWLTYVQLIDARDGLAGQVTPLKAVP